MNIGEEQETLIVEPIESPVPGVKEPAPVAPAVEPVAPEPVPA